MSLVVAACGSTVPHATQQAAGESNELGAPASSAAAGDSATAPTPPPSASVRIRGSQGGANPDRNNGATQSAPRLGSTLRLGVVYLKGLEAAYSAVGASNATVDSKAATQAVVDDINKNGGVAGRKIDADYYAIDANSATPRTDQLTAACEHYLNDHPVDAVASYTGGNLVSCLAKRNIPLVNGFPSATTAASTFAINPRYYEPAGVSLDRLAAALPGFLVDHRWIDGPWPATSGCPSTGPTAKPKLGVVTFDTAEYRNAADKVLAPAFARAGHPVVDTAYLTASGNTAQQLSSVGAGIQSAILRFESDCVDHVVFMSQVAVDGLFMLSASQQHYTPRYGFSSADAPVIAIPDVPDYKTQMRGSIGMGWVPFDDVNAPQFDDLAAAPARRCLDVLKRAGIAPADNNSTILALPSCESTWFIAALFTGAADTYKPSGTYALSSARQDGPSSFRDVAFADDCGCFRYTSGLRTFS